MTKSAELKIRERIRRYFRNYNRRIVGYYRNFRNQGYSEGEALVLARTFGRAKIPFDQVKDRIGVSRKDNKKKLTRQLARKEFVPRENSAKQHHGPKKEPRKKHQRRHPHGARRNHLH